MEVPHFVLLPRSSLLGSSWSMSPEEKERTNKRRTWKIGDATPEGQQCSLGMIRTFSSRISGCG